MAFDIALAERIRGVIPVAGAAQEKKMFGGLAFLVGGHMACGVMGDRLLVRVPPGEFDATLEEPHAAPMELGGRTMRGFVAVEPAGIADRSGLERWVGRGIAFASSLTPK